MTSLSLAPGGSGCTIHGIGDSHYGATLKQRLAELAADMSSGYEALFASQILARVQVGDFTARGQHNQWIGMKALLAQFPPTKLKPSDSRLSAIENDLVAAISGNHDYLQTNPAVIPPDSATTYGLDFVQDFTTGTGLPLNYSVDLGPVVMTMTGWGAASARLTTDQVSFLDTEWAAASPKRCIWVNHAPLYATVGGRRAGKRGVVNSTETPGFYVRNFDVDDQSDEARDLIAGHDNVIAMLDGHTHTPPDAPGSVFQETLGGKLFTSINCSAIQWTYASSSWRRHNPVRTPYIDIYDDALEIRWRDHRLGTWVGMKPGEYVRRVAI